MNKIIKTSAAYRFLGLATSVATLALLTAQSAHAQSSTWLDTGTTSPSLGDSSNWVGGVVPGNTTAGGTASTDVATFNTAVGTYGTAGNPITIDAGRTLGGISFATGAGNYTIGSTSGVNPLYLSSGGSISMGTAGATENINASLVLGGNYTFTDSTTNGVLNFGGAISSGATSGTTTLDLDRTNTNGTYPTNRITGNISDGGHGSSLAVTLTGNGYDTWFLSGNNTYSGGTTLASSAVHGFLGVGSNTALGTGALTIIGNGAVGATTSGVSLVNTVQINGNNGNAFFVGGAGTNGNSLTFTGGLTQNNSQVIDTELNSGVALTFSGSPITINSAAGTSNSLTLNNNFGQSGSIIAISSVIQDFGTTGSGKGSLIVGTSDKGVLKVNLSGANTYSGGTQITNSSVVQAGNANALGKGNVTISGGTLQGTVPAVTLAANLSLSSGVLQENNAGVGTFTLTGSTSAFSLSGGTWELNITGAGNDLIASTGGAGTSFTITGGTLSLAGDTLTAGQYTILSGFGTGSGQFTSITGYDTSMYTVTFNDTSTPGVGVLDVTTVPEPSTWAMLLGGLGLLIGRMRWQSLRNKSQLAS